MAGVAKIPFGLWSANLRTARQRADKSQKALGDAVGRNRSAVAHWEDGSATPRQAERFRLASVLGVPVDELFPLVEPAVITAARAVCDSRSIADLQRSVVRLQREIVSLDEAAIERQTA